MRTSWRNIEVLEITGKTTTRDIEDGVDGCRDVNKCMERVAIARALRAEFKVEPHESRVKIDAGHVTFNLKGFRWEAKTPRIQAKSLIKFDDILSRARRKKLPKDEQKRLVTDAVKEHDWKFKAIKGTKIQSISRERQDRINKLRRERYVPGEYAKPMTLRKRVIGFR